MTEGFAHRAAVAFEAALRQVEGLVAEGGAAAPAAATPASAPPDELREPAAAYAATADRFGSPEELGERAALLAVAARAWSGHLGALLDTHRVQALMGVGTRQAVSDRAKRGGLLALPTADGRRLYPAFQFGPQGQPHAAVAPVLAAFAAADVSPYTLASWFKTPQDTLDGATPAAWMAHERDEERLVAAAARTAARLGQ